MSIVTALFGTVRNKFTEQPLYSPRQPSFVTMFFATVITPPCEGCLIDCAEGPAEALLLVSFVVDVVDGLEWEFRDEAGSALPINRRWICNLVRTTS